MKVVLILVGVFGVGIVLFLVVWNRVSPQNNNSPMNSPRSSVNWMYDYGRTNTWKVSGNPPACPDPLVFDPPIDVNLATSVLYPGQYRSGDYKPHGGFRFDNRQDNLITVTAPMDGYLYMGARHPSEGEFQYVLYFKNDCGIIYKLDHLLTLTPKFQQIIEKIPMGGESDTRTTGINPAVYVAKNEVIATEVGLENFQGARNVFFDFGVYDIRSTNEASKNPAYASEHKGYEEFRFTALCWLNNLTEPSKFKVASLPGGDSKGKISDYCN